MTASNSLSPAQARKLVLLSQGIHRQSKLGRGKNAALKAIELLGYVQIDTISVVERAHHHVLWSRTAGYQTKHLDALLRERRVFEYWSHAAAYLPMRDYRFSLPRKLAHQGGEKHWFDVEEKVLQEILRQVRDRGPLQSRDFEGKRKITSGWGEFKLAKRALELLFMRGELMIVARQGFQKIYDLTERALPEDVDTGMPSEEEYCRHLVSSYTAAQGLATASQTGHLRKGMKAKLAITCEQMHENGELARVTVKGRPYYARADFEQVLIQPLSRTKVVILSPFDNLVIQRDRIMALFDLDYQIECYVPEQKRKHGYFVLPILWGQKFAGRMDAKINRKSGVLTIKNLYIETPNQQEFLQQLSPALDQFCRFTGGHQWSINNKIDACG